jgi:hypothetical protein
MTDQLGGEFAQEQPIPRFGDPEEVARMTRFLLCEATYSTGSGFVVDGGAVTGQVLPLPSQTSSTSARTRWLHRTQFGDDRPRWRDGRTGASDSNAGGISCPA